jgi:hypothetical protein
LDREADAIVRESGTNRLLDRGAMPRDIRELRDDPEAYAAELRRRWGGLLSYRYVGRSWPSMDLGPTDNTVTLRRDMRGPTGAVLLAVLGIAAPEGGGRSDLEAVPNPVIHSCQVLDPGYDVRRLEVVSEVLKQGRQMGYSRSRIVDADKPGRVLALTQGQGISLGAPPDGLERMPVEPIVIEDGPHLPPLWQVFGATRRPDGHWALPVLSAEVASPDAALHLSSSSCSKPLRWIWRPGLPGLISCARSRHTSCSWPAARSGRSEPMPSSLRDPSEWRRHGSSSTMRATATVP